MPPAPKHLGRWYQFGLGTMFRYVTVIAFVWGLCAACPAFDLPLFQPPIFRRPTEDELATRIVVASAILGIVLVVRAARPDSRER
jgi:hypothetical protein